MITSSRYNTKGVPQMKLKNETTITVLMYIIMYGPAILIAMIVIATLIILRNGDWR